MKRFLLSLALLALFACPTLAQNVGINATGAAADASALLDVSATNKGLLIPRIALTGTNDVTTIATPATSLLIYNTGTTATTTPGFYYWNGTLWVRLHGEEWSTLGNTGTNPSNNFLGTTDAVALVLRTQNVERMRISDTGNVGIDEVNPADRLHVSNGNIRVGELNPSNTGTFPGFGRRLSFSGGPAGPTYNSDNSDPLWISRYNPASDASELRINLSDNCNTAVDAMVIQTGGAGCAFNTPLFRFQANGLAYKPGGGTWAALSDRRLKHSIRPFSAGLAVLRQVRPVRFQYNGKGETADNGTEYVGVIAQEIAEIAPEMVQQTGEYLSVDPSAFTYMLINAVQEQQGQIEQLESEKSELAGEMDDLRSKVDELQAQLAKVQEYLDLKAQK